MSNSKRLAVLAAALCVVVIAIWAGMRGIRETPRPAVTIESVGEGSGGADDAETKKTQEERVPAPAESEPKQAEPSPGNTSHNSTTVITPKAPAADEKPAPPTADIDSGDPKYYGKSRPEIIADGKPVTVLYRPPHMFGVILKAPGEKTKRGDLTLATMTVTSERGSEIEIHILLRDKAGQIEPVGRVTPGTIRKGQAWTKSVGGLEVRIEVVDHGTSPESPVAGSPLAWLKLQVSAEA